MMLGLDEIAEIFRDCRDDADALDLLVQHRTKLEGRLNDLKKARRYIDSIITAERKAIAMTQDKTVEIVEKHVPDIRIAAIRWKGRYCECGRYMGRLAKHVYRYMVGPPFNMYHDEGYKEEDADVETCVQVRDDKEIKVPEDIKIRILPGGKVVSLTHKGPYDQLGRAYEKINAYLKQKNYCVTAPPREIYIKGPGMIFKGNPNKYLTEIQFPV
jgi:effector-binding domain-containing protein